MDYSIRLSGFHVRPLKLKELSWASFILDLEIHRDISLGMVGLFQNSYIDRVLKTFNMNNCPPVDALTIKYDDFSKILMPFKKDLRLYISYASVVGSLMYAQVCINLCY